MRQNSNGTKIRGTVVDSYEGFTTMETQMKLFVYCDTTGIEKLLSRCSRLDPQKRKKLRKGLNYPQSSGQKKSEVGNTLELTLFMKGCHLAHYLKKEILA